MSLTIARLFEEHFENEYLCGLYYDHVQFRAARGTDGIGRSQFEQNIGPIVLRASNSISEAAYRFRPYRAALIPRGPSKLPRIVESPVIIDKLVLRALHKFLIAVFYSDLERRTLHSQLKAVISEIETQRFDTIVRIDVRDFYPSIRHNQLLSAVHRRIKDERPIKLIRGAISTCNDIDKAAGRERREIGIPQGLPTSGVLANIFLFSFDNIFERDSNAAYFRYVDDMLIACNHADSHATMKRVRNALARRGLRVGQDKSKICSIKDDFQYLGYKFGGDRVTVRTSSVNKIYGAISGILTSFMYSDRKRVERTLFRLSLRITGCIFENRKYGWLFFFSQINDERLLHGMDQFVKRKMRQVGLESHSVPSFVRAFYEINHRLDSTRYIPKFDEYDTNQKGNVVAIFDRPVKDESDVDFWFKLTITREVQRLERDMSETS